MYPTAHFEYFSDSMADSAVKRHWGVREADSEVELKREVAERCWRPFVLIVVNVWGEATDSEGGSFEEKLDATFRPFSRTAIAMYAGPQL